MKTKLLLIAIAFVLGLSSCATDQPCRNKYPATYRTYQDRDHGGGGDCYRNRI